MIKILKWTNKDKLKTASNKAFSASDERITKSGTLYVLCFMNS